MLHNQILYKEGGQLGSSSLQKKTVAKNPLHLALKKLKNYQNLKNYEEKAYAFGKIKCIRHSSEENELDWLINL